MILFLKNYQIVMNKHKYISVPSACVKVKMFNAASFNNLILKSCPIGIHFNQ